MFIFCYKAQKHLTSPPMGFMTWNYFGENISEQNIKSIVDEMVTSGLRDLGYNYIFIDDGWQGGRDNKNNIIPDNKKFPSGIKALADYIHKKGMKIGIYSDAAPLTCAGYTGSLNFEEQDAKIFAEWGIDYLKYDYCGAPADRQTAEDRYSKMSQALKKTNRDIVFAICEWGQRQPWLWAKKTGAQLWRTTGDIRDKWSNNKKNSSLAQLHSEGFGILDIININATLNKYTKPGGWNDLDMLIVGLYGKEGAPSSDLGGNGCTDIEYQSQMSLWCLMGAPLMISNDIRQMNNTTKKILTNKDIIAIDQDPLCVQAERKIYTDQYQVFVKPLSNGDVAIGILNTSEKLQKIKINLSNLGIIKKKQVKDIWNNTTFKIKDIMNISIAPHETKVYRIS
ncbi:glycoside hydrolase family 27 protein [Elizabethkingia anophelis]|nr:glycoside hydrolase family 27 protein [Elizabethkingia anophelis]MCT3813751.1 glycoside hydrolase family 27 protein [Elizabethkingia anophelis]MCT3820845.1 glycoside hydrolase family 27 protein [Elizabethkingia anophelis]